ncbi:MAG: aminotransferase class I/II-fold pyridoxal phosphate-dependent enzyme [SAR202 cluster bacterium]|jgi:threonine aldolase|nr:aminotransferase class I/II-fold pyridoxal phosphate-dependent enzyme [SAR202 cluster bacterium]
MRIESQETMKIVQASLNERQPEDSDQSVVFRGDGEPKTPRNTLRKLTEFEAEVGLESDTFSMGGTVEKLEKKFAEMLGKERAIFMPTGTLANHLATRKLCGTRPRAIVQEQSHLYNDTGDCVPRLSGISLIPLGQGRPGFTLDELRDEVGRSKTGRVETSVGAVMIESPVRRQAGQVVPYNQMEDISSFCRQRAIPVHLDGARLYMMSAATGVSPQRYAALFDTVYVSLYKYFGAPFGAVLAGTEAFIDGLYHERRMFGGGLVSAYLPAALALNGTEGFEQRFAAAMEKAAELFHRLNSLEGVSVGCFEHGSNIFPLVLASGIDGERVTAKLKEHWVFLYPDEAVPARILLTVNTTLLRQTNDELFTAFEEALNLSRVSG